MFDNSSFPKLLIFVRKYHSNIYHFIEKTAPSMINLLWLLNITKIVTKLKAFSGYFSGYSIFWEWIIDTFSGKVN